MRVEVRFFQKGKRALYNEEQTVEYFDAVSSTLFDDMSCEVVFVEDGRQMVDHYEWVTAVNSYSEGN